MRRSAAGFSKRYPLAANTVIRNKPIMFKKIPAGCPAGEGGMVEEIYIHYYRHLVQRKVTPFWKKNARNCSGGFFGLPPPPKKDLRVELQRLVRKLLATDIMAVFTAFLEFSCGSLRRGEVFLFSGFLDIASTLTVCLRE